MAFVDSEGARIYYDDRGGGDATLLCLPGWCVHHTMFVPLAERLSTRHRVLSMDWRGHGESQAPNGDFGYAEMITDALNVIHASGAESVIPIAQAHGGWVAIELSRRLGQRVPKMIFTSWNPMFTSQNPLAASFLGAMEAAQDKGRWRETVEQLLTMWLSGAPTQLDTHIRSEMGSHGFEDWARAAREISAIYAREADPLKALDGLSPSVPALHVYTQPRAIEYLTTQEAFARVHPWFAVRRLEGVSHFPTLEVPEETAQVINDFIH